MLKRPTCSAENSGLGEIRARTLTRVITYKAAQAKDQDKILDAVDAVTTTACTNCHMQYRDKTQNVADRCL